MARGKVTVTAELLMDILHLPPDTVFIASAGYQELRSVSFIVEHPGIKAGVAGQTCEVSPQFSREDGEVVFKGWGQ